MPNPYQAPMAPWPVLAPYARSVSLPKAGLTVFIYDRGGSDRPVTVLIHGLGDEADTWRHIFPALADRGRVIALDLPGFGRSDKPKRGYGIPFFRDVVLELLDVLGIQRATLVGHSLGAVIAHFTALSIPARVDRLVLIGGALVARPRRLDRVTLMFLIPGVGEWLYTGLRKDPQAAYASLAPFYHDLASLPQADRDFLFQRVNERVWSDGQRRGFLATFRSLAVWLPGQQKSLPTRIAGLTVPTLVIWGEGDVVNSVEGGRALVELQPSARLVIVPNAGHNVHQEHPAAILDLI